MTHTFAILPISQTAYEEIKSKLIEAGYQHAILEEAGQEVIDMHGIACAAIDEELNGAELITQERKRQIEEEGWSAAHDDSHYKGEMATAAFCYLAFDVLAGIGWINKVAVVKRLWPWDWGWWKPKDQLSNLVRAGALIAAEIDRLQRKLKR